MKIARLLQAAAFAALVSLEVYALAASAPQPLSGDARGTTAASVLGAIDGYPLPAPTPGTLTFTGTGLKWK